jgi:hypothetical protein
MSFFKSEKEIKKEVDKIQFKKEKYECYNCNKKFGSKQYLQNHKCQNLHESKKSEILDSKLISEIVNFLNKKNDLTKDEMIIKLLKMINTSTNITQNNIMMNNINSNNIQNITNFNGPLNITVQLRNFGDENLAPLYEDSLHEKFFNCIEKNKIIDPKTKKISYREETSSMGLYILLKDLYFNDKYPENHNIRSIENHDAYKNNEFQIYDQYRWSNCDDDKLINKFINIANNYSNILNEKNSNENLIGIDILKSFSDIEGIINMARSLRVIKFIDNNSNEISSEDDDIYEYNKNNNENQDNYKYEESENQDKYEESENIYKNENFSLTEEQLIAQLVLEHKQKLIKETKPIEKFKIPIKSKKLSK